MKTDFNLMMTDTINNLEKIFVDRKPSLLLHACCAPCSSSVLERLVNHFDITILFYNPNIYPRYEYERRLEEIKRFSLEAYNNNIKIIYEDYNENDFYEAIKIKENPELATESERGKRCYRCISLRIKKTFLFAYKHNFDFFCTTLSVSPHKDVSMINEIEKNIYDSYLATLSNTDENNIPKYLFADFKKKDGYLRSLQLSEQYNLYRQEYCGCVYSMQNRQKEKSEIK